MGQVDAVIEDLYFSRRKFKLLEKVLPDSFRDREAQIGATLQEAADESAFRIKAGKAVPVVDNDRHTHEPGGQAGVVTGDITVDMEEVDFVARPGTSTGKGRNGARQCH